MNHEKNKIIIVFIVLLVLLSGIIVVRRLKKPTSPAPIRVETEKKETQVTHGDIKTENKNIIILSGNNLNPSLGETTDVHITLKAPGRKVFGADLVILYDPGYIETRAEKFQTGGFFTSYPRISVDEENGIIKISAYQGIDQVLGESMVDVGRISFTAKKVGNTTVEPLYEIGSTNTTTIVEAETSQNILESVAGVDITIE